MKIYDQQRLESLEEKKAAHMRTWCEKDLQTLFWLGPLALCYALVIKIFVNALFQSIFHKFLHRFTQNLLKCKSTFIISFVHFL